MKKYKEDIYEKKLIGLKDMVERAEREDSNHLICLTHSITYLKYTCVNCKNYNKICMFDLWRNLK